MEINNEFFILGREFAQLFKEVSNYLKPGLSTKNINDFCADYFLKHKILSATLGYRNFPAESCTSLNRVVCHGIPNRKDIIRVGDIFKLDISGSRKGFFVDTCFSFLIPPVSSLIEQVRKTAYEALWTAISIVKAGIRVGDIGFVLENIAKKNKFSVIRDFCSHGIGTKLHQPPFMPFYGKRSTGEILKANTLITIEPMVFDGVNMGDTDIIPTGLWPAIISNGTTSAQFEHTILIKENGCEVLTFNFFDEEMGKKRINDALSIDDLNLS